MVGDPCKAAWVTMRWHLIGKTKYRMEYCKLSTYIAEGLTKLENITGVSLRGGLNKHGKM